MAKKQKYICGNCRQEVELTDEVCSHCKAALEPIDDAVKAKAIRNFRVGRDSIPVFTERLKKALEVYALSMGNNAPEKANKAKEIIRVMTNDLNKATSKKG